MMILPLPSAAGIYKCTQGAETVYSDKPCPQAKTIDTTNASTPTLEDQYRAKARSLREQAAINAVDAQEAREKKERINCQRTIRDHNWTMKTAAKYKDDEWWRNQGFDSEDHLIKTCGKYLIPSGAGHAP